MADVSEEVEVSSSASTYDQILTKGYRASLEDLPLSEGKLRFTEDTGELFLDLEEERIQISRDLVTGMTQTQITTEDNPLDKIYLSSDTHRLYYYDDNALPKWQVIGEANVDSVSYATNAGTAVYSTSAGSATSATNAASATYATNAGSATHASTATNADTATYATNAGTADYATNAGTATKATNADTATYATNAGSATHATNASSADYSTNAGSATYATNAGTATNADTATYATNAGTASRATADADGNTLSTTYSPLNSPVFTGTPTVPDVSSGDNSQKIANTKFVTSAISSAIGSITGISFEIVSELPASGTAGVFYLLPNASSASQNIYDEYIWTSGNAFEKIGSTEVDLTGYYNATTTTGAGNAITSVSASTNGTITFEKGATFLTQHPSITTSTAGSTSAAPAGGATFDVIDAVTTDENGHVTSYRIKTVTMVNSVANADTATYATNAGTSDYATNAGTAAVATNASSADYATNAGSATFSVSAGSASAITDGAVIDFGTV